MSVRTRSAASSFSLVTLPRIFVLTGPAAGNVSLIVSAWKRIAASARTVEYTPHASSHGSVRSSYLKPSTSIPLTNVSAHSLREPMSVSISSTKSPDKSCKTPSSSSSARFSPNSPSSSSSSLGPKLISTPPSSNSSISTSAPSPPSGISASIPISNSAPSSSSNPSGAA